MKVCVLFLFFAIRTITCDRTSISEDKLIVPVISGSCKNIKCSAIEDPRCVKIRQQKDTKKIIYIIAVNKCEIQYMKCHEGYEAKIVPMKYCGHKAHQLKSKNNNHNRTDHTRVKRNAITGTIKPETGVARSRAKQISALWKHHKYTINSKKSHQYYSDEDDFERVKLIQGQRVAHEMRDSDYSDYEGEGGHKVFISRNIDEKFVKNPVLSDTNSEGEGGYMINNEAVYHDNMVWLSGKPQYESGMGGYKVFTGNIYDEDHIWTSANTLLESKDLKLPEGIDGPVEEVEHDTEFPLISKESANNRKGTTKSPDMRYEDDCPDFCPSRNVMVCARCQHGIYKTFISVCHMRKFLCMYSEEVLHLVSRYPCVMSAPYISAKGMLPQGRVVEPGDDDRVIRFIKCRSTGKLKANDPRCIF